MYFPHVLCSQYQCTYIHTVQLTSKLILACSEHVCVLQFLLWLESKHACDTKWAAHESTFVYCTWAIFVCCTWVIICVLHDSKKHASNASCAAHDLVFLCAAYKLTAIFCQRMIKAYNEKAPQQNVIKYMDTKKIIFCQVFTYPYFYRWHLYWTNWMPNTIIAQGLDSIDTNNLTHLVAQCDVCYTTKRN